MRSLSSRGVSARGVSHQRSLLAQGVSCREESPRREEGGRHNNQNVREVRGEEEDGCGGSRDGGQGAGDISSQETPRESHLARETPRRDSLRETPSKRLLDSS